MSGSSSATTGCLTACSTTFHALIDHCCDAWNKLGGSALDHHVSRHARLGTSALIKESWYKLSLRCKHFLITGRNASPRLTLPWPRCIAAPPYVGEATSDVGSQTAAPRPHEQQDQPPLTLAMGSPPLV